MAIYKPNNGSVKKTYNSCIQILLSVYKQAYFIVQFMCTSISNVTGKNHPGKPQTPRHDSQGVVEGVHRQGIPVSTVFPRRPKDHRGQENKCT